jgi:hypothetical protein
MTLSKCIAVLDMSNYFCQLALCRIHRMLPASYYSGKLSLLLQNRHCGILVPLSYINSKKYYSFLNPTVDYLLKEIPSVNATQLCLTTTTAISHSSLNPVPAEFTPTHRIYVRQVEILLSHMCLYLQVVYSLHREYNILRTLHLFHACYLWH